MPRSQRLFADVSLHAALTFRLRFYRWRIAMPVFCLFLSLTGCDSSEQSSGGAAEAEPPAPRISADVLLDNVVRAYQDAPAYRDRGRLRLRYRDQGQVQEDIAPLAVSLVRPNRLRLEAYQATIASDGTRLRGNIVDEASENLDGQFLDRDVEEALTLEAIYGDSVLSDLIHRGLGRQPITLELLLSKTPLEGFRAQDVTRELLSDANVDGRRCYRLQVETSEGAFVLWIDQESMIVHRLEYPAEALADTLQTEGEANEASLMAEFYDAQFSPALETRFVLDAPEGAKRVTRFVAPPQPLPSTRFGQRLENFEFEVLRSTEPATPPRNETRTSDDLRGRITVLLWLSDHPAGRGAAEQLARIRSAYGDKALNFLLVCTDAGERTNEDLLGALESWDCDLDLVRDRRADGRDRFGVRMLPTLVILDKEGLLHVFDEGFNPRLEGELPAVLDMLRRGESVATKVVEQSEMERLRYAQGLAEAGADPRMIRKLTQTKREFPPPTEPFEFALETAWECRSLKAPGNLLVLPAESNIVWVNEGWRSVAALDRETGEVLKTHALDLPEQASVSMLTTPRGNGAGRIFAATDILARQAHVFDSDWNRLFSYPDAAQEHNGIRDILIRDLAGEDSWRLVVGFWELLGVHAVDSDGNRVWSNRELASIGSLASRPLDASKATGLWATGGTGRIVEFNGQGESQTTVQLPSGPVDLLFPAGFAEGESIFCAVSRRAQGGRLVRGLDRDFAEVWSYENLPAGAYESRVRLVSSGTLTVGGKRTAFWALAGVDGSVHLISHDGRFNDLFYVGEAIHGLTIDSASASRLIIATGDRVQGVNLLSESKGASR